MAELFLAWKRNSLLKRLELEEKAEVPEEEVVAVQDQESTLYLEFPVEVRQPATTATKRATLPENAINLLVEEREDHLQKALMADALSVMRRAIKRSTVPTEEEIAMEGEAEADPVLTLGAYPRENQDLDLTLERRKSKFIHHAHIHVATLLPAQDQDPDLGQDPDRTQRRAKGPVSILKVDLPMRNQKNTNRKAAIGQPLPKRDLDLTQESPAVLKDPAVQDRSQR